MSSFRLDWNKGRNRTPVFSQAMVGALRGSDHKVVSHLQQAILKIKSSKEASVAVKAQDRTL